VVLGVPVTSVGRPIAIDLYAGSGGMSCGFDQAGFDIVLAIDNDPYHIATHRRNYPYGWSATASVAELCAADLRKLSGLAAEAEVDLLFGGPPCQGFSHMGFRDVEAPRNSLVDHFVRIVSELRPRAFVMENVPGMNTGRTRPIFDHAVRGLEAAGYRLTMPVRVLNATEFGVPQARRRLFILSVHSDCSNRVDYPKEIAVALRPTVANAFEDIPDVDLDEKYYGTDVGDYAHAPSATNWYARYARGIETGRGDDLAALVERDEVAQKMGWHALRCARSLFGELERPPVAVADGVRAYVLVVERANLPTLGRMLKVALRAGCRELVLVAAITDAHVLTARYRCSDSEAVEMARGVFAIRGVRAARALA